MSLDDILAKPRPEPADLAVLLASEAPAEEARLFQAAYAVKTAEIGKVVQVLASLGATLVVVPRGAGPGRYGEPR